MHPYLHIKDHQHWKRAMSLPAPGQVDIVTSSFAISPADKVATLGSCFAQHISRHLASVGCTYFVAEEAPADLSADQARARNYRVFSARYGNVYTIRQALQLFERAFGDFDPQDNIWTMDDTFVDPFRPTIEPGGFRSKECLLESRNLHLKAVKTLFLESDVIVFTLGLTEAWRSKLDGAVFPIAPGVNGGRYDSDLYEFVNFTVDECRSDLGSFIRRITAINSGVRFLLTVSPVPLMATYEQRHVWESTVLSKSTLRVAAAAAADTFRNVTYFPSFEVITSPAAGNLYYRDDLRQVTDVGVKHVMRLFSKHFLKRRHMNPAHSRIALANDKPQPSDTSPRTEVVCDEDTISHAIEQSGQHLTAKAATSATSLPSSC
jgi:hypothetical protein